MTQLTLKVREPGAFGNSVVMCLRSGAVAATDGSVFVLCSLQDIAKQAQRKNRVLIFKLKFFMIILLLTVIFQFHFAYNRCDSTGALVVFLPLHW